MGGGDAAILGGTFLLALAVMRLLEKLITLAAEKKRTSRPGKDSIGPPAVSPVDDCVECRRTVTQTSWAIKSIAEGQGKQLEVLGEIRDGVRDLTRTPTGRFNVPFQEG
jgi:hypothetical protein